MNINVEEHQLDRYVKAVQLFGNRYYGNDEQLKQDLEFMSLKYIEGGGWDEGREHACKELFKLIFNYEVV